MKKIRLLILCGLLTSTLVLTGTGCASKNSLTDYDKAYAIGLQAYTYGLPLLETNKTFLNMTNGGKDQVNQFIHVRSFNNPDSRVVVAPGASGLSSIAWLDLSDEPHVLHVPQVTDHYFMLALLDPYTEDIVNLSSAHDTTEGDYVICGPDQHDIIIPPGTTRISVDYTRIWIIGSTQVKDSKDISTVNGIQDGYTITPLSKYGTDYQPQVIDQPNTIAKEHQLPFGLEYFDTLGKLLQQFPPPAADKPQIEAFTSVGIGPGLTPSKDSSLNAETIRGLKDAAAAGPEQIKADTRSVYSESAKKHNGYFVGGFGTYGTNYQLRAAVAMLGLGAVSSDQTIFALTLTDQNRKPWNGGNHYIMHIEEMPPVTEGWSITVYDANGALIRNSIDRYQLNQSSDLIKNPDGSVDIFFQADQPETATMANNWLPVAKDQDFRVIFRLFAPDKESINGILNGSGWQPPVLSSVAISVK